MSIWEAVSVAEPDAADRAARFFNGLADPTRLRIVTLLLGRPRTVGEIVATLLLRQARVSNALACLKWCGYVEARREGRHVWYAVSDPRIQTLLALVHTIRADHAAALASCTLLDVDRTPLPQAAGAAI